MSAAASKMNASRNDADKQIVVTANAFDTGEVVYLSQGGWTVDLASAQIFSDADQAQEAMVSAARPDLVVGAYLIDVEVDGRATPAVITPTQFREKIRAIGPTNYHHGKQEQEGVDHVSV